MHSKSNAASHDKCPTQAATDAALGELSVRTSNLTTERLPQTQSIGLSREQFLSQMGPDKSAVLL